MLVVGLLALGAVACGDDEDEPQASPAPAPGPAQASDACEPGRLALVTPGTLTVGTDKPAFPPYFEDDDPTNGKGFESAVAYAVAGKLGFAKNDVKWTTVPFNSSYAPGPKDFDFDINQISITPKRAERVDFSMPYYTAPQAVVALKTSPAASATSLSELADAKLGVQIGTTSLDAVTELIKPTTQPQVFNDSNDTVRALKTRLVDAIVVDLPTAFFLTAAEIPEAKITGQFAAPGGDDWGLVLAKDSKLTPRASTRRSITSAWASSSGSRTSGMGRPGRRARAAIGAPAASPALATPACPRGAHRRRAKRQLAVSAASTVVVLGLLATLVLTSEGLLMRAKMFFNWDDFVESFPAVLDGVLLDIKLFVVVEAAVLVLGYRARAHPTCSGCLPSASRGARRSSAAASCLPGSASPGARTSTPTGCPEGSSSALRSRARS